MNYTEYRKNQTKASIKLFLAIILCLGLIIASGFITSELKLGAFIIYISSAIAVIVGSYFIQIFSKEKNNNPIKIKETKTYKYINKFSQNLYMIFLLIVITPIIFNIKIIKEMILPLKMAKAVCLIIFIIVCIMDLYMNISNKYELEVGEEVTKEEIKEFRKQKLLGAYMLLGVIIFLTYSLK